MKYCKACSLSLHFILLIFSFSSELELSLTSFSLWNESCPLASSVGICWSPGLKNYFFCLANSQLSFRSSLDSQLGRFSYSRFGSESLRISITIALITIYCHCLLNCLSSPVDCKHHHISNIHSCSKMESVVKGMRLEH